MNDDDFNMLLGQVRNCLMPTLPIEGLFNVTFKIERPKMERTQTGGFKVAEWVTIKDNVSGALDDYCHQEMRTTTTRSDATPYALYCKGDVDIKEDDEITINDEKGNKLTFSVDVVRNPMMRYKYLVVWCRRSHGQRT